MTASDDLSRLGKLAQMSLDHRLGQMRIATAALERSRAQLAALAADRRANDLPLVISAKAGLTYDRWADLRRSELNLLIARQTADWLTARDGARNAFGRLHALRAVIEKLQSR